jgi:hypothetical protein
MLAQALRAEGAEARALPHRSSLPEALGSFRPGVLILLTLDALPPPSVELQLRLLRRRLPGVRLGIAHWPSPDGTQKPFTGQTSADFVARGMEAILAEAFAKPDPEAA